MLRVAGALAVIGSLVLGLALGLAFFVIQPDSESSTRAFRLVLTILPTLGTGLIALQVDRGGVSAIVLITPLLLAFSGLMATVSMFGVSPLILVLPLLALFSCIAVGLQVNREAAA